MLRDVPRERVSPGARHILANSLYDRVRRFTTSRKSAPLDGDQSNVGRET